MNDNRYFEELEADNRFLRKMNFWCSILLILISIMSITQSVKIHRLEDSKELLHRRLIQLQNEKEGAVNE